MHYFKREFYLSFSAHSRLNTLLKSALKTVLVISSIFLSSLAHSHPALNPLLSSQTNGNSIQTIWQDNPSDKFGFVVFRRERLATQINFSNWALQTKLPPHATSYLQTNLKPGTIYQYLLRSANQKKSLESIGNAVTLLPASFLDANGTKLEAESAVLFGGARATQDKFASGNVSVSNFFSNYSSIKFMQAPLSSGVVLSYAAKKSSVLSVWINGVQVSKVTLNPTDACGESYVQVGLDIGLTLGSSIEFRADNTTNTGLKIDYVKFVNTQSIDVSKNPVTIDVMLAFTPNGKEETESLVGLSGDALGQALVDQINDTYEKNKLGRPYRYVGSYNYAAEPTHYGSSVDMHVALVKGDDAWAAQIHQAREALSADIVMTVFGNNDTDDHSYAGQAYPHSNYVLIWGRYATIDLIMQHELGHEFGLAHNTNPSDASIMRIDDNSNRLGFTITEANIIASGLTTTAALRTNNSNAYVYNEETFSLPVLGPIKYSSCTELGNVASTSDSSTASTLLTFTNSFASSANIYWLDYAGNKVFAGQLSPNQQMTQSTATTHPFMVEINSECVGVVTNLSPEIKEVVIKSRTQ